MGALHRAAGLATLPDVVLVRHGRTFMNEHLAEHPWGSDGFADPRLFDTRLSPAGRAQAAELARALRGERASALEGVGLVCASPLSRALETAELALAGTALAAAPRLALPAARERLYLSSDVGRPRAALAAEFGGAVDWSLLGDDGAPWWFDGPWPSAAAAEWRPPGAYVCAGEPEDAFRARMRALRAWLIARPERAVCVVSHWGVIRALTGADEIANCALLRIRGADLLEEPRIDA